MVVGQPMHAGARPFATPEDAYRAFFRADSAQDAKAWANVMSYPHVRVSAHGSTAYFETPEAYASGASWTRRMATGWVRSVGIPPTRLHESADKVHLAGGWTRYNAKDEPILRNRVTYVLTRVDGAWGIQARFGTDSFAEGGQYDAAPAIDLVRGHLQALARRDFAAAASSCRHPFAEVGVARVDIFRAAADLENSFAAAAAPEAAGEIVAAQSGSDGVVVAATWDDANSDGVQAVFVVGRREGLWRIAGRSAMRR